MNFLEKKISKASQAYYSGEDSGMTDEEFDKCMNKYVEENPEGELLKTGHGYDVNKDSTPGEKYPHIYGEAGSLSKVYTWKDFIEELKVGDDLHMSLKIDGLSIVMYYTNGKLDRALTRGDGHIGIDITEKALLIDDSIMNVADKHFTGATRGEVVMRKSRFEEFKKLHPEAKNPRNSAAGLINAKVIEDDLSHFLDIIVYTVIGVAQGELYHQIRESVNERITRRKIQSFLERSYKYVSPYTYEWIEESSYEHTMNELKTKWYDDIPADGIVLSDTDVIGYLINIDHPNKDKGYYLEYTSQAFKFRSETAESTVVDIEWELSKHNRLKPVIVIEPVDLAGTTVQRATGYNAQYIQYNKIAPTAVVEVEKRGEIIPNVNKVVHCVERDLYVRETCPVCGADLFWEGVDLVCKNPSCNNIKIQDILIWLKNLVPTFGLGDSLIKAFVAEYYGGCATVEDLMSIDVSTVSNPKGKQDKLFLDMINALHTQPFKLKDALLALNIPRLGEATADKLATRWEIVDTILMYPDNATPVQYYQVLRNALGDADSKSISENIEKFQRLAMIYARIEVEDNPVNKSESYVRVAITGKLSVPRKQFEEELKEKGYTVKDISKDTKFLITDDPNSASSKNKKADKLGIEKLTESQFRDRYLS